MTASTLEPIATWDTDRICPAPAESGRAPRRPAPARPDPAALLPVIRRLLQSGRGPAAVASWVRWCGVAPGPRPAWTDADERTADRLAARLARWLDVHGGLAAGADQPE
jgi:hypothetical protein